MGENPGSYAAVNGLNMYYEVHGEGRPLVLLHGAFSAIGTSFGLLLPLLAKTRQCIAVEMQGHGRTADIDRPLRMEYMADDVAALIEQLGIDKADVFGYSVGAGVAMHLAIKRPDLVGKLVLATPSYRLDGLHPGLMDNLDAMSPDMLVGSPFHDEYVVLAPDPDHFAAFFEKKKEMDKAAKGFPEEDLKSIKAPMLLVIGDSDIVTPEHAVEMFRLVGGGVIGDLVGLPRSQLAVLPGTTHVTLVHQADLLAPMVERFLARPADDAVGSGA